jgi:hypothetical protein
MFYYKKPFTHIFIKVADFLYKHGNDVPYLFHFQGHEFETKTKFEVYDSFMNNNFYGTEEKDQFECIFQKSQAFYYMLTRFYHRYCYKKAVKYDNSYDLSMEPLYMISNKQKFRILHENTVYVFSVHDLVKIIETDLLNHDRFFPDPQFPKNPYNNIPFTKSILYNFYFYLRDNNYTISSLFTAFYNAQLNIHEFLRDNEIIIRSLSIKNYNKHITNNEVFEEIILLLRSFKIRNLYLHIDFPRNIVIEKTLKLVKTYWHSEFELTERLRRYYRSLMFIELDNFLKMNHGFGRIYFKRGEKKELPHHDYKIQNLLSQEIPDYQRLNYIIEYMEKGIPVRDHQEVYISLDDSNDEDLTDDQFGDEQYSDASPLEDDTVAEELTIEEEEHFNELLNELENSDSDDFSD